MPNGPVGVMAVRHMHRHCLLTGDWSQYHPVQSKYKWPKLAKPSTGDWMIWNTALASVFQTGRYYTLNQKLGHYFPNQMAGWFYDADEQALWWLKETQWTHHSSIPSHSQTRSFHTRGEPQEEPEQQRLHQATIQVHETKVILSGSGPIAQSTKQKDPLTQLLEHKFSCTWHWEVIIVGNLNQLLEDIQVGEGYAVSDGSFQEGRGAMAWIIKGRNKDLRIIGTCLSPSDDNKHSLFCSKLAGIYATLFTLQLLLLIEKDKPKLQLTCNGKSVLSQLKWQ